MEEANCMDKVSHIKRNVLGLTLTILLHAILDPFARLCCFLLCLLQMDLEEILASHFLDPISGTIGHLHPFSNRLSLPVSINVLAHTLGHVLVFETCPLVVLKPRIGVDVSDRVLVADEPVMVTKTCVENLVKTFGLGDVARLAVSNVFWSVANKVVGLACAW